MPLLIMRHLLAAPILPLLGHHQVHRETTIPEASGMTTTIPKTSGKRTKIGMRTRMKRGMSGMTAER